MKEIFPFIYEVEAVDDLTYDVIKEYGLTFAKNFSKAMKKIEDYYGSALVSCNLFGLEEGETLTISEEVYNQINKEI